MLHRGEEPIPGYTLENFLGKGTFGEVWKASAPFGVKVALKFIDVSGKAGLKEFRGIQRVKDIRHAHLMPITSIWMLDEDGHVLDENAVANLEKPQFDASETMSLDILRSQEEQRSASLLIVAMLLADDSLKARLEACVEENGYGIPLDELLDYMEQAARGIDFLNQKEHDIGDGRGTIQHCDIKPENMMLVGDSVVICDFGLAQLLGDNQKTSTGMLGTPAYIAPEVLLTQRPSPTTDQYSLACTYLHLRSGDLPFDPTSSLPRVFEIHKTGKLNFAAIKGSNEQKVVRKAASVDPNKRYASNLEFIRELRQAIAEDQRLSEELQSVRIKRYLKRTAAVLMLLAVVGGGGYLASPYGRPHFDSMVGAVAGLFKPAELPPPPTAGSGGSGGGSKANFAQFEKMVRGDIERGDWDDALRDWHSLPHADFPEEAENLRRELLDELLALAAGDLDEPESKTATHSRLVIKELAATPQDSESENYRGMEKAARLLLSRASARSGDWDGVRTETAELTQRGLTAGEQRLVSALQVLERCATATDRFFDDDVLNPLGDLSRGLEDAPWEGQQLDALKFEAFGLLESGDVEHDVNDPRLAAVFGDGMRVLQTLSRSSQALQADRLNPAEFDFAALRSELESAEGQASGPTQGRVRYLRAILELSDPSVSLAKAGDFVPTDLAAGPSTLRLAGLLLDRAEKDALAGPLSDSVTQSVDSLVTAATGTLASTESATLAKRSQALRIINQLHGDSFDQASLLTACERVRGMKGELPAPIATVVDACWAECQIMQGVSRATRQELNAIANRLGGSSATNSKFGPYLTFVRARLAEQQGDSQAAMEHLGPLLAGSETPRFLTVEHRQSFAGQLLTSAAAKLKTGADHQITTPAYEGESAERAADWLQSAVKLGVKSSELRRDLTLASYYGGDRDFAARLLDTLELSPSERSDGQLLRVQALVASEGEKIDTRMALRSFADLFAWAKSYDSSSKLQFHQSTIQPALALCERLKIGNLRNADESVNIEAVPEDLRPAVAEVFSISAKTVEDDFDTANALFPKDESAAVEYRYYYFRVAAALQPSNKEFLIGQYWALRDWPGRDYKAKADELFQLAQQAHDLDTADPEANGILGEAWVSRSRGEVDTAQRKQFLSTAISHFDVALESRDQRIQERFLPLRSTANVETAYLIRQVGEDKISRLKRAASDAEQATRFQLRPQPEKSLVAWGNAMEDLAFYCRQDPNRHFRIAIDKFGQAAGEAMGAEGRATALMSLGRCRFRRAAHVEQKYFTPSQPLDLAAEIEGAIEELKDAVADAQSDAIKSESLFWLSSTYDLQERRESNLEKKIAAKQAADKNFQEAIRLAGELTWAQLNWAWARRAYFDAEYDEARKRAERILAERGGDNYIVHWSQAFDALKVIFLSTPPDERPQLVQRYAQHLPESDPSALYYRIRWFLLVPKQLMRLEYIRPFYNDDFLLPASTKPNTKAAVAMSSRAAQLASSGDFPDLEAQANTFLALLQFNQWQAGRTITDPENALFINAKASLTRAATQLLENDFAGLTMETVSLFALRHGFFYFRVSRARDVGEAEKDRIRREEVPRIESFQTHVQSTNLKKTLNQFLGQMR